jgi:hypothetical protein
MNPPDDSKFEPPLTRAFRETVRRRAQKDPAFAAALRAEGYDPESEEPPGTVTGS